MTNKIRRLKLVIVLATAAIAFFGFYNLASKHGGVRANSSGAPPTNTNAPGEQNCRGCHGDFALNSGGGSMSITGLPMRYEPGAQYPLTVTLNHQNGVVFGFQTTAVNSAGQTAGTYILPAQTPAQVQTALGVIDINGNIVTRRYVGHTQAGIIPTVFNTKSWNFTWTAPTTRQGGVQFYASGNAANSDGSTSGDYIYTTSAGTCSTPVNSSFDGDRKADISVFRPSNGAWYSLNSTNGAFVAVGFGQQGDRPVAGDYDNDGKNDIAVFRPSAGGWYILLSGSGAFYGTTFGQNGDVPVVGDFTGDGRADLNVWRPSNGTWYTLSINNGAFTATQFGASGDKPVSADFDADGKNDYAVYRPSVGGWYYLRSSDSAFVATTFGIAEDKPVPGDYDNDGKTDIAVFRPSNGGWYILRSSGGFTGTTFGQTGDQPAPSDYDGDCRTDIAVFRAGAWYIINSTDGSLRSIGFGSAGDIAVPNSYTPE